MNRHTAAGDASVSLLCATFDLSRAAYYAEARRQRGEDAPADDGKIIALPRRPRHTSAEVVLLRIREVLERGSVPTEVAPSARNNGILPQLHCGGPGRQGWPAARDWSAKRSPECPLTGQRGTREINPGRDNPRGAGKRVPPDEEYDAFAGADGPACGQLGEQSVYCITGDECASEADASCI